MKDYPGNERHQKADTRQKFYQQAAPPSGLVPNIACIILNWNGSQDTVDCLDALQHCTYSSFSVIVVDNGSTDDSVARIRTAHPGILLLESGQNLGFAGGNNIGIRHALVHGADYVWLLNNDTQPAPRRSPRWSRKLSPTPASGPSPPSVITRRLPQRSRCGPARASICG